MSWKIVRECKGLSASSLIDGVDTLISCGMALIFTPRILLAWDPLVPATILVLIGAVSSSVSPRGVYWFLVNWR